MNIQELLDRFRIDIRDDVGTHYLWSNAEIYSYIDEAQKMFCRLTDGIPDSVSAITSIAIAADAETAQYDKRIKHIRRAYLDSDKTVLSIINDNEVSPSMLSLAAGKVRQLAVGMDAANIRLIPATEDSDTIKLSVFRLPLITINAQAVEDGVTELEIDEMHHRYLLYWMMHLAYQKQDSETYNEAKIAVFEKKFRDYCVSCISENNRRHRSARTVRPRFV
jgi:hypothetical protein